MGLIFNKKRKSKREAEHYYHTTVLYGQEECDILLTESDVKRAIYRAQRNQEDRWPGISILNHTKWYKFWR
jgi:hypothetical protein